MNKETFLKYLYNNNYNNVYEHAINICNKWGLGYAISNIGEKLPAEPEMISIYNYIMEHPETIQLNCGETEEQILKIEDISVDLKTQYKGIYGENDDQINNVITNETRFFLISATMQELMGIEDETEPSILNNWKSIALSQKDDAFHPCKSYKYYINNNAITIDYFPAPDETDYENDILWFATGNYLVKGCTPYENQEECENGQYIFDTYIENNANTIYILGDRIKNTIMACTYDYQNNEDKYSNVLQSPINLNRTLFIESGIIWKTTIPNYDCTFNTILNPIDLNDETIQDWLNNYYIENI